MLSTDLFEVQDAFAEAEGDLSGRIHGALLGMLEARRLGTAVCPSEAARALALELHCEWRDLMRPVRYVAGCLAEQGVIEILQHGHRVDLAQARGPIRMRLRQPRLR